MSSDDDDLRRAITLSLAESKKKPSKDEPIVISSDDDEPQFKPSRAPSPPRATASTGEGNSKTSDTTSTFLSERAQLEAARLARLKRMRDANPKPASDDPFVSSDEDVDREPPAKKSKLSASTSRKTANHTASSSASAAPRANTATKPTNTNANGQQSLEEELFWGGELRQTANMHVDRTKDTRPVFRLSDILGNKSDLTFCILSAYVTQLAWIYSLLPPTLPVILVAQPDQDGAASVHNVLPNWVKVAPQLPRGRGCMHIKFLLLFYKTGRVRLVIPTANLVDYDWRDIENSVWLQDIPSRARSLPHDTKKDDSDFGTQFERVLTALDVPEGLRALRVDHPGVPLRSISDLRCGWDFSKVKAKLVASLVGKHDGWPAVLKVGHIRLMRVVREIGARADADDTSRGKGKGGSIAKGKWKAEGERDIELECQTSSIGSYTPAWIDEFFGSARGASPESWLDETKARRARGLEARVNREGWPPIKILFPSLKTVQASRLGEDGGGTMFCQRRQWNGIRFPRVLFHDSNSRRGPVLMHSKMILATFSDDISTASPSDSKAKAKATSHPKSKARHSSPSPEPDSSVTELSSESDSEVQEIDPERDPSVVGWAYVGSHNFTPSAWGTLSGSSFRPVMNITNFELGVVIPLKDLKEAEAIACWERPPRKYDLDSGKDEPWIQKFN